jgi:ubiquinone/menaquinone biosynthesis C-methylase UbiE
MIDNCNIECGLFDFMANNIGIKVLHPGGYEATEKICPVSYLTENSYVLDLACGTGTTSFYLAKKFNCKVTGIDISPSLIEVANKELGKFGNKQKVDFKVADAFKMPFPDNTFDFVIAQAFFILVNDKTKALEEIYRVLKPGGYIGSLELSWFKTPPKEVYDEILIKTCTNFVPRMVKLEEWEEFFKSRKLTHIKTIKNPMPSGMLQMLKAEGIFNFVKIIVRMIGNRENRKRMMDVQKTFKKYNNYLGYGIFCFMK